MNQPSWQPVFDADLRICMLARTGPWLQGWLETMKVEDAERLGGTDGTHSAAN